MISIEGLNQFYGSSQTLWDVTLSFPEGACTVVMGRNGVGKTTLLKSLMGVLPVRTGSIRLGGKEMRNLPSYARVRLGMAYVPQGREIFPRLTVEENLRIGLMARRDRIRDVPEFIYEMFPVLSTMLHRRGGDLSGGQQQQLAIGRALCTQPQVLILDEPTEGIQPNIVEDIGKVIQRLLHEYRMTVLLVEQKVAFARCVAQYFALMEKGRVVTSGRMEELDDRLVAQHLAV
jgi:urea transport system ATP-binding protein